MREFLTKVKEKQTNTTFVNTDELNRIVNFIIVLCEYVNNRLEDVYKEELMEFYVNVDSYPFLRLADDAPNELDGSDTHGGAQ